MTFRGRLVMRLIFGVLSLALAGAPVCARAEALFGPFSSLQTQLSRAANNAPGTVGIAIEDLATGAMSGVNEGVSLPAASTIKIPVMVEVFGQMASGRIDLNTKMHLQKGDRDWGSGDLADGRQGTQRTVEQLLWLMINDSDNTATNMLIRLVGRQRVNATMRGLGLHHTQLGDYIRSAGDGIRYALRSSPRDMVRLLDGMARNRLVDEWSSKQMLSILTGQTHNSLLPQPLPRETKIAHKTGSLHDTLNDVGIVYLDEEPYVIAVMTTQLPSLSVGRRFIHKVSRIAYDELGKFAHWRQDSGMPAFTMSVKPHYPSSQALAPDLEMWNVSGPVPPAFPDAPGSLWGPAATAEPAAVTPS